MIVVTFLATAVAFAVLDFLWLGYVMKDFNLRQLAEIGRISDGDFQILYGPAAAAYMLMSVAVVAFVLPQVRKSSWLNSFFLGALMGLVIYGIFDMTNMAILKNYPWSFAFMDMLWGTFVYGVVTLIAKWTTARFA